MKTDTSNKQSTNGYGIWLWVSLTLVVALAFLGRYPIADDAYITFRYAENVSRGHGLLYNMGQWVLGTTSPLWAFCLSLATLAHIPLETFSCLAGLLACAFSILVVLRQAALINLSSLEYLAVFASLMLFPIIHMGATSGMEAALYVLLILLAFEAALEQRQVRAGILAALCLGLRPDGILVPVAILVQQGISSRRIPLQFALTYLALVIPALCIEYYFYGALIPHSVLAKRVIHSGSISDNLYALFHRTMRNDLDILAWLVGLSGLYCVWRFPSPQRSFCLLIAGWLVLYILGLVFSGVDPIFYWYYYPILLFLLLLGVSGLSAAATHYRSAFPRVATWEKAFRVVFALAVLSYAYSFHLRISERFANVLTYAQYAPALATAAKNTDTFYLCETGLLGYELKNNYIFDSSGINSPEVLAIIEAEKQRDPQLALDWHAEAVRRLKPSWVVALAGKCSIEKLAAAPGIQENYRPWQPQSNHSADLVILQRL
ncbi:MAG: hypothetical protein J0M12_12770 [Deltaproteobacteria bacterium]|nr:hypothetical protein [Deltaproteobacteria bacterium]